MLQPIVGLGLPIDHWPHFNLSAEVKYHSTNLAMVCGEYVKSPAVFAFVDQDYIYKSVVIQIPHDAGLAPVHTAGYRTRDRSVRVNLLLLYGGGLK